MTRIGVISDTHGLMRPEALDALSGSDLIVHAGDIGDPQILDALQAVAPVDAVRGNIDTEPWAGDLPQTKRIVREGIAIYVLHDVRELDLDPGAENIRVVISGHSHQPRSKTKNGIVYLNPGSAGPRRFTLPVAIARLTIDGGLIETELVDLQLRG